MNGFTSAVKWTQVEENLIYKNEHRNAIFVFFTSTKASGDTLEDIQITHGTPHPREHAMTLFSSGLKSQLLFINNRRLQVRGKRLHQPLSPFVKSWILLRNNAS
uniref:Uncharacterized protein n=1 Tax=Micrurus lemniscatus lemniscatus TaxID=129467 RepID=A0A2D4J210_MICLE